MKISLQEYSDSIVAPEYKQELKSLSSCLCVHGWESSVHPICCGKPLVIENFIGATIYIACGSCGKFAADMSGPKFGNGHVSTIDPDKVDKVTPLRWITGITPVSERRAS